VNGQFHVFQLGGSGRSFGFKGLQPGLAIGQLGLLGGAGCFQVLESSYGQAGLLVLLCHEDLLGLQEAQELLRLEGALLGALSQFVQPLLLLEQVELPPVQRLLPAVELGLALDPSLSLQKEAGLHYRSG
jgi:hypothetical protein